mmetsp:Transcript_22328/g.33257  ORF Transcript_22328/g.33257 Transcript_22328/m.33257 type:complete len:117 (+) Transcript_22328:1159-1509(+)
MANSKIALLFAFETKPEANVYCSIVETKRLDLPDDAAKSERFQWWFVSKKNQLYTPHKLTFASMEENKRSFAQGELEWDDDGQAKWCSFNDSKETFILFKCQQPTSYHHWKFLREK